MQTVRVELGERSYEVTIGPALLASLGERVRQVSGATRLAVISDRTVFDLYGRAAIASLTSAGFTVAHHLIEPGDASKSLAVASEIYDTLYDAKIDRSSCLIALGGGVVGDLTGFVAATWLRGVPFVQVATTLEADIDASVGGKTAVNHPKGKNLIGAFHQPVAVMMDTDVLRTLSARDIRAGLSESIKHGVIRDAAFFEFHEQHAEEILRLETSVIEPLLAKNVAIKASVVGEDEREHGVRAILNFGHTIGHAVEVLGGYGTYRHGEAVAIGMVAAGRIAVLQGRWTQSQCDRMERVIERFELPTRAANLDAEAMIDAMQRDKKVKNGKIRFVLPTRMGFVDVFDDITVEQMREGIRAIGM